MSFLTIFEFYIHKIETLIKCEIFQWGKEINLGANIHYDFAKALIFVLLKDIDNKNRNFKSAGT